MAHETLALHFGSEVFERDWGKRPGWLCSLFRVQTSSCCLVHFRQSATNTVVIAQFGRAAPADTERMGTGLSGLYRPYVDPPLSLFFRPNCLLYS